MFRLATALTTAALLALHATPLADARISPCSPTEWLGKDGGFFNNANNGGVPLQAAGKSRETAIRGTQNCADEITPSFDSLACNPVVYVKFEGRTRNKGATLEAKAVASPVTSPMPSPAFAAPQSGDFIFTYTPGGSVSLMVQYGTLGYTPVGDSDNTLTNVANLIGIEYRGGGGNAESQQATTSVTITYVNGDLTTPFVLTPHPGPSASRKFYIKVPCDVSPTIVKGTFTFSWTDISSQNPPFVKIAVGDPDRTPCPSNQEVVIDPNGDRTCGCDDGLVKVGQCCVCPGTNLWPMGGECEYVPVPAGTCLKMPALGPPLDNAMMSQEQESNQGTLDATKETLPAKGCFGQAGSAGTDGLFVTATALADGLKTAEFKWIGDNTPTTPATCGTTFTPASNTWSSPSGQMLSGLATYFSPEATPDEWDELSKYTFTLTLGSQHLADCGFETTTGSNSNFVYYKNTLCGHFKFEECYSDAYGFVTVPTEVKTCYVVTIMIPKTVQKEATVHIVDQQKVDMRFSSLTRCDEGPVADAGGRWKTDLEFKTIVQYPYKIDTVTVTPVDSYLSQPNPVPTLITNNQCTNISSTGYTTFGLPDGNTFPNLDTGDLEGNSYCRQDWTSTGIEAYVGTASADCDKDDVERFTVTVTGKCQDSIGGAAIACPVNGASFTYSSIVEVPKVCTKTLAVEENQLPATLQLFQDFTGPSGAGVPASLFTPGSELCGELIITPAANALFDDAWLPNFDLTKVEVFYTTANSTLAAGDTIKTLLASTNNLWVSNTEITATGPPRWIARFCFMVDATHIPGLLHTVNNYGDLPDKTSTLGSRNGISIYKRQYTVRATATLTGTTSTPAARKLRTRVDRILQANAIPISADAESDFTILQMVDTASKTTTSSTGDAESVKAVSPESAQVQAESKQSAGLADGAKIGIGVGVGIGALAALVIGAVVIARRRAA